MITLHSNLWLLSHLFSNTVFHCLTLFWQTQPCVPYARMEIWVMPWLEPGTEEDCDQTPHHLWQYHSAMGSQGDEARLWKIQFTHKHQLTYNDKDQGPLLLNYPLIKKTLFSDDFAYEHRLFSRSKTLYSLKIFLNLKKSDAQKQSHLVTTLIKRCQVRIANFWYLPACTFLQ